MSEDSTESKEYAVSINTDDIREAIAAAASALYTLTEVALGSSENQDIDEHEFEVFLRDTLGVLIRHAEQWANQDIPWDGVEDEVVSYD